MLGVLTLLSEVSLSVVVMQGRKDLSYSRTVSPQGDNAVLRWSRLSLGRSRSSPSSPSSSPVSVEVKVGVEVWCWCECCGWTGDRLA